MKPNITPKQLIHKVHSVLLSCNTWAQFLVARRYADLAIGLYPHIGCEVIDLCADVRMKFVMETVTNDYQD